MLKERSPALKVGRSLVAQDHIRREGDQGEKKKVYLIAEADMCEGQRDDHSWYALSNTTILIYLSMRLKDYGPISGEAGDRNRGETPSSCQFQVKPFRIEAGMKAFRQA